MTRQDTLAQTERLAFQGVMRAYAELGELPVESPGADLARRRARDARCRWTRALADLDRSMSWQELRDAA